MYIYVHIYVYLGYLHLSTSPYAPCIWVHLNPYVMILIYILNYALYYTIVDPQTAYHHTIYTG